MIFNISNEYALIDNHFIDVICRRPPILKCRYWQEAKHLTASAIAYIMVRYVVFMIKNHYNTAHRSRAPGRLRAMMAAPHIQLIWPWYNHFIDAIMITTKYACRPVAGSDEATARWHTDINDASAISADIDALDRRWRQSAETLSHRFNACQYHVWHMSTVSFRQTGIGS